MKRATAGTWIVGLLILGPFTLIQLIELVRIIAMPPCGEHWDAWCADGPGARHILGWSHASKTVHTLQAAALLALFCGASFVVLRAAHRRQPLSRGMRYGVLAAVAAWIVVLLAI